MSVGRVGDAHAHKVNIRDIAAKKSKIENAKAQSMSGLKYSKAHQLGGQVVLVSSIQREIKMLEGFVKQNESAVSQRLEGEEFAIRNILDEAIRFKESLVLFNDGNTTKDPTSFLVGFKQHLTTVQREGNAKVGDSYILGGTITNLPPFDVSKVPDGLDPNSGVSLDYYSGNDIPVWIAIDNDDNLACDLMGKHPAFEKFIRALKIANDSSIKSGDARVIKAQELVDEAIVELAGLVSQAGAKEAMLDTLIEDQEDRGAYLLAAYLKIVEATPEESATTFMTEHTALATAYAMISRMNEMSLANYLK